VSVETVFVRAAVCVCACRVCRATQTATYAGFCEECGSVAGSSLRRHLMCERNSGRAAALSLLAASACPGGLCALLGVSRVGNLLACVMHHEREED
jgi:hypothetical protein